MATVFGQFRRELAALLVRYAHDVVRQPLPLTIEENLQAFLESLRPDQLDKLQDVLTPMQQAALLALYERFAKE